MVEAEEKPIELRGTTQVVKSTSRVYMLDVVRGWSMFFISGGDAVLLALCLCFPKVSFFNSLRHQLGHVPWEGFTFYDALFPTFLLISGAAFTYSWHKQITLGVSLSRRWGRLLLRTLLLIVLGVLYNGALSAQTLSAIRFPSVLARIGLGVLGAALVWTNLPKRWRWLFFPVGLLGYVGLFAWCGGPHPYAMTQNWAGRIDQALLPGCVDASAVDGLDPEGVVSTLGAIFTAYLGMLLADFLRTTMKYKALWLALAGGGLLVVGYGCAEWVPIIKKLWTATYVCVAGGWSLLACAALYCLTDCLQWRKAFAPISFFGVAALWFYLLPKLFDFRTAAWRLVGGCTTALTDNNALHLLVCASMSLVLLWIMVYLLRRAIRR